MGIIVKENIDFKRGQDSKRSLKVGAFAPGTIKDFEDVEIGDKSMDYGDQEGTVVSKTEGPYKPFSDGWGPDDDNALHAWVQDWDSTGAGSEMFTDEEMAGVDVGENIQLIATRDDQGNGAYVFPYGYDGAYAVWE